MGVGCWVFTKPTDSKAYLHFQSDHPQHTKRAIPHGLGVRIKRICSKEGDYERHREDLKFRLVEREYPEHLVEAELNRVDRKNRKNYLRSNREPDKAAKSNKRVPMVITFSSFLPDIRKILKSKRHIL